MNATTTKTKAIDPRAIETADYFRKAIQVPVFWALGVDPKTFVALPANRDYDGGLKFTARILPFTQDGQRSERARLMDVSVHLTWTDEIDIEVRHRGNGKLHAEMKAIFIDQLNPALLALDWNGDEPFNPRYI